MDDGQQLHNGRFCPSINSLIRAVSILMLSGGATLGLLYASFWAGSSRLEESRSNPSFAQDLQDWRQDSAAFLVRSEPNPELNPRSVTYTIIAIAGLGTGLIVFGLLERANHRLRLAQAECDRNWQAYQQALEEKSQVEEYATTLATQYHQLAQAKTAKQIELQAAKEAICAQRDQALEDLQQVNTRVQHLFQQHQNALAEQVAVKSQIQQLESGIQQITQQYQQTADQKAEVEAQIQHLKAEKRRWIDYVERSHTDDYEALNHQYETLQQQFDQLQADHQQLQSAYQQLQYRVDAQEIQIQAQYEQYERAQEGNAAIADHTETAIMLHTTERDLYEHEKRDLVLEILERHHPNLLENSRRQHILQDILNTNQPTKRRDELAVALRHLFWDYRSMKAEIRHSLSTLGFELIEDGTHYKIIFQQDNRYQITFSKTSSDRRAGRNIVSEIRRRLL